MTDSPEKGRGPVRVYYCVACGKKGTTALISRIVCNECNKAVCDILNEHRTDLA